MLKSLLKCVLFVVTVLFISGCLTTSNMNKASYNLSADELDKMSQSDNITQAQKVILKHAALNLKQAEKTEIKTEKLQDQLVKESKLAGAGKMIYTIIFLIVFGIISYFCFKILKRFYII